MRLGDRRALGRILPLSLTLFRTALRAQQRRSLLGHLWLFLPAAAAAATASYVRSRGLLNFDTPGLPYGVFVFAGTILWQVFVEALNAPLAQVSGNRTLVTRLNFPHGALILSGIWMVLLNAAVRIVALLLLCAVLHVGVAATVWLIPLGICGLALLGLALGLFLAPFGLLYDDVGRGLTITTAFLFFVMPIAYPIAGDGWQALNPILPLINTTRGWLIGEATGNGVVVPVALAAILLLVSWPFYRLSQPHVIERLG